MVSSFSCARHFVIARRQGASAGVGTGPGNEIGKPAARWTSGLYRMKESIQNVGVQVLPGSSLNVS